jgi:uncharacterized protein (TIGR03437 family)
MSNPIALAIVATAPALFTATQDDKGQAAVVNQDGSLSREAPAGTYLQLYGTGFGAYRSPDADGLRRLALPVSATLGGVPLKVLCAGEAPGYTPGLQQINVMLPPDLRLGALPIVLEVGSAQTQPAVALTVVAPVASPSGSH